MVFIATLMCIWYVLPELIACFSAICYATLRYSENMRSVCFNCKYRIKSNVFRVPYYLSVETIIVWGLIVFGSLDPLQSKTRKCIKTASMHWMGSHNCNLPLSNFRDANLTEIYGNATPSLYALRCEGEGGGVWAGDTPEIYFALLVISSKPGRCGK